MTATAPPMSQWNAVRSWLDGLGATYEPVEHPRAGTALEHAEATGFPPEQVAKVILVESDTAAFLFVLPADQRLALPRLRNILGTPSARLATEDELMADTPVDAFIDWRLIEQHRVLFPGGDHRHSFVADPREVVRITEARVANVCRDS